jgi:hypothetical protein
MSASLAASDNSAFDAHFIAELRSRVSLTSLVGRDVAKLERDGRRWKACCPFHGEKTPSFTIYEDGHFHCFGCQAHGDAISYIRQRDDLDFPAAVAALAAEAGMSMPDGTVPDPARQRPAEARRAQRESDAKRRQEREQARKHAWAARAAEQAAIIRPGGTGEHIVARLYLGIDRAVPYEAPYPESIRYDLDRNALVAIATDRTGQITGGQRIYLDRDGHRLTKAEAVARGFEAPKETFGTISGSTVHLPARDKPWMYGLIPIRFIVESVEAGASIWQVTGQNTDIILGVGNLRHAFRKDCANVVALDDDARGSAAWKQANKAIRMARAAGHVVLIVNTWQVRRGDKTDLNDVLRQSGPEGPALLRKRLTTALYPEAPRRKRLKAADGIRQVRSAAVAFMQTAIRIASGEEQPLSDVQAMRGDTGVNKSTIMRELLADAVRAIRKAGNDRPALIFVPRIDLAEQQAGLLRDIAPDLDVRVWRGRSQRGMCGDLDSIGAARARMLDPQKHVCDGCAIFAADGCNYQVQRGETADIWFVSHAMLYERAPRPLAKPCLIWIDETPVDAALVGITADDDDNARVLPLDTLRRRDPIADKPTATDRLLELRGLALAALETLPPGALTATPFHRVGLTAAVCQEAQKLEWSTKIEPDHDAPIERADLNLDLGARARFWLSLAALLDDSHGVASGWLRIATDREGRTVLRMRGRRPVNAAWKAPTMLTDASLDIGLVRHLWPSMQLVADIAVEARHQHIRQVIDRSYGLSSLDANDPAIADNHNPKADAKIRRRLTSERGRRRRALRDIHAILHGEASLAAPGRLLAVAQKRIVAQIEAIGPLPRNLDLMHHGAVSGDDRFRNAARIVVIGRQAPAPAAVEACAEALTGAACTRLPAGHWYQRIDAVHELADGRFVAAERDHHPDAIAEAFRRRVTALELQQIIGRGRGIWRTAASPLHILVLTDVPLDLPVDELITDAAVRPSFEDRQIAASGIASQCAAHAAKAHPELWPNADRAQYARRVYGSRQPAGTVAWRYQVAGQGEKPALTFAPSHMPAEMVQSFWTDRLGPLAIFERAAMQPKGASNFQSEETSTGNSRYFGADDLPERPLPFMWAAWKAWHVEHPPDG